MPSHIQQEQLVKHLEEVGTGLVENGEDKLPRKGQFLEQVEDLLAVSAGKSTCWLVEEQDWRIAQQFQSNVDALSLTA
jgi:hypothetical protein